MTVPSDIEKQCKDREMSQSSDHSSKTGSKGSKTGSKGSKASHVMFPVDESVLQLVREHIGIEPEEDPDRTSKTGSSSTKCSRSTRVVLPVESSVVDMVMASGLDNELEEDPSRRKTRLYFGVCCDVRLASIVQLLLYIWWMLSSLSFNYGLYKDAVTLMEECIYDDDIVEEGEIYAMEQVDRMVILMIKNAAAVPFSAIGIYGAFRFNKYLVLCAGIWCIVDVIWGVALLRPIMLVLVFTIYPLFALFEAIHSGKMTSENYRRREKHCCCIKN